MMYEQKTGNPKHLDGRLTVYAKVAIQDYPQKRRHPAIGMLNNGLLAAEGDFRHSSSLKDFFKQELGLSLEEGFKELLSQFNMGDLPGQFDPDTLKDRLENFKSMEEFIPMPAKMITFNSETEILARDGDVFFLGEFENFINANLAVNAFPVFYQAIFKEQLNREISREINAILQQASKGTANGSNYADFKGDLEQELLTKYIPEVFYSSGTKTRNTEVEKKLINFMTGYPYPEEIKKILSIISDSKINLQKKEYLVELFVKKIVALTKEDFKTLKTIQNTLDRENFGVSL
ncbi:MAG: hypothetical protein ABIA63_11490 [bacterium]